MQRCKIGILDVKEPSRGGLGASDRDTLEEIVEVVRGSKRQFDLSFSAGELGQWRPSLDEASGEAGVELTRRRSLVEYYGPELLAQYRFVKVGLAGVVAKSGFSEGPEKIGLDWQNAWRELFVGLPEPTRPVAVSYLDYRGCDAPSPDMILQLAAEAKDCEVVLFDTCHKSGNLFSHVSISELNELVQRTRSLGLIPVVAGSVCLNCLSGVVFSRPGFVGVRGAVCRGDRVGKIALQLVEEFVSKLDAVVGN